MTSRTPRLSPLRLALGATALTLIGGAASADQQILDDLIVDGSICAGLDCVNGESFGFDTLRLKENNLRIRFFDTSTSASFPTRDWQLTANDSTNGGLEKFSIDDIDGARTPFTIEAGARNNALYVEDSGEIGIGTNNPVVNLHVVSGNTPTLRLEQDGSQGFTAQTWDLAGNEANFFIRDATNGSTLPFRIQPGAASNVVYIASDEQVGLGTTSPDAPLEVQATAANIGSGNAALKLVNTGGDVAFQLDADDDGSFWNITHIGSNDELRFSKNGNATGVEMTLAENGNLTITGTLTTAGANYPDYVFAPDYELMPLHEVGAFIAENGHLPKIPTEAEVMKYGMNISEMQVALLEKVEELTLYTLQQQKTIEALQAENAGSRARIQKLEALAAN